MTRLQTLTLILGLCFLLSVAGSAAEAPRVVTCTVPQTKGWYLTPDTKTLIMTSPTTAELIVFDVMTATEKQRLSVPFKPACITGQGDELFVSVDGSTIVHALDAATGKKLREYRLPGEPVQSLASHPESGSVFAANLEENVFALDPKSNRVIPTIAKGMYLRVDPKKGQFLLAATNRPSEDVIRFQRTAPGVVDIQRVTVAETATVSKYSITGSKLKMIASNPNTAVGAGGYLHLSPDGSKYIMVAGGGWWSPTNAKTRFGMAVFPTDDFNTMLGGLDVGGPQNVAFHPDLPIGIAQGANYDFFLFDAESLVIRQTWKHKPQAVKFWENLSTFGAHGSVYIAQQGEYLQFFILDLNEDQQQTLAKLHGPLPKYPQAVPLDAIPVAATVPTPTSPPSKPGSPPGKPSTPPPSTPMPEPIGQRKAPKEPPVRLAANSSYSLGAVDARIPYIGDRQYAILKFPRFLKDAAFIVRDSSQVGGWLSRGSVEVLADCSVSMAIMYQINGQSVVSAQLLDALKEEGWTPQKEILQTTSADKEIWQWAIFSQDLKAGTPTLSSKVGVRSPAQVIYFFHQPQKSKSTAQSKR
jgi:hypothetical protein